MHGKGEMRGLVEMEDTYTQILDKFAKSQYNPKTEKKDFKSYAEMKKVYTDYNITWGLYFKDLEKAISLAIREIRASDIAVLEEMEKQADFFYEDSTDLAQKSYERGRFDTLHNAIAKLKEIK